MVLVDQTFSARRQQKPRVCPEIGAAAPRATGLGTIIPEPGEIVSAGAADILGYGHRSKSRLTES